MQWTSSVPLNASTGRLLIAVQAWCGWILGKREAGVELDGLPSLVESQKFLEVRLKDSESRVDGWIAKSVAQETEVGEARIRIVRVVWSDVTRPTDCIEHGLEF